MSGQRIVAFGGGHGLAVSLRALRLLTDRLTAVVTVADDGGSSGRLRAELGVLPPGDLRMALCALTRDDGACAHWSDLLQHRFPGQGELGGHAVGNLMLAGLVQLTGDPVASLDMLGRLLGLPASTRVLPMSCEAVHIVASVRGPGRRGEHSVSGQHAVATTSGEVLSVALDPPCPVITDEVLAAVERADGLVFGPGSLFTSVLPHLLAPDLRKAVLSSTGTRVLVLNLAAEPRETRGFSPGRHLEVLRRQVGDLTLDVVVADRRAVADPGPLREASAALGAHLVLADVADPASPDLHAPERLAEVLGRLLAGDPTDLTGADPQRASERSAEWRQ